MYAILLAVTSYLITFLVVDLVLSSGTKRVFSDLAADEARQGKDE